MTSMRREMRRLEVMRRIDRQLLSRRSLQAHAKRKARENAEALARETPAEKRARLTGWLEWCEERAPRFEEQAAKLRAALAEMDAVLLAKAEVTP